MNCTQCGGALTFDQESLAFAVETHTCGACGATHYDATRFDPYKVEGVAYTRRGSQNVVMYPVEPPLLERIEAVGHVVAHVFGARFASPLVIVSVAAALAEAGGLRRADFMRCAEAAWDAIEKMAAVDHEKPS